jgi:hypothetical protein
VRVIHHLQQEIAELVLEPLEIASCDRIRDLIGFVSGSRSRTMTRSKSSMR